MDTRQKRHRRKLREAGIVRFSVQLSDNAVETLRRLAGEHQKTQSEVLDLAIQAADGLLAGRLVIAKPRQGAATVALAKVASPPAEQSEPALPACAAESWWPEGFETLLEEGSRGRD